jgi:tetratricopeptide (TPR) repeat protein
MQRDGNSQKGKEDWLHEALNHYAVEHYEETLVACEQALLLDTKYARAHHGKGLALMSLGRYEEAVTSLNQTLRLTDRYASPYRHARILADKGRALYALKLYKRAFIAFSDALHYKPFDQRIQAEHHEALSSLVNMYMEEGRELWALKQYEEAFSAYQRAASLVPTDQAIQAEKASILFQLAAFNTQAREEAQEAQRLAAEKKAKDDAGWLYKEPFRYE